MMKKHLIVIIDDSWPCTPDGRDTTVIDYQSIKNIVMEDIDWKELNLKRFIKDLILRSSGIDEVEIIGFYRIEHYIQAIDRGEINVPNILIIDWDFGIIGNYHKANDYLPKVIEKGSGLDNIYIFSRSENMREITECLILPEMIAPGIPIYLYDKGKKEHEQGATLQKLIDRALRKVENVEGRFFYFNGKRTQFFSSFDLKHYLDFWKVEAIIGFDELVSGFEKLGYILNKSFMEFIFSNSALNFYTDSEKKYLLAGSSEKFIKQLGPLNKMSALDALQEFGINKLEKAIEKSVIQL